MEVTLHEYEYDEVLNQLDIYFSLDMDEIDTQRFISLTDFEVVKYTQSNVNLSDLSIMEIVDEPPYVLDILMGYIETNENNLPEPEYI